MSLLDLISKYASPGMIINAYSLFGIAHLSSRMNRNRHYRENLAFWNSPGISEAAEDLKVSDVSNDLRDHMPSRHALCSNDSCISVNPGKISSNGDFDLSVKSSAMGSDGKYIEHQDRLTMLRYGGGRGYTVAYGGCEMIAVYNIISFLNDGKVPPGFDLPDIIWAFEGKGIALEGAFGASPRGMVRFLKNAGLSSVLMKPGRWNDNTSPSETLSGKPFIFTAFNDRRRIMSQVHTMAATPEPDGSVILHNSNESPAGYSRYRDPADAIINYRRGFGRVICVICL
ncbi:MAG: hypothetical protein IJT00_00280 [Lachnospiraceae bacterium]|nr:hypothetical protein [Lachnospiraceae bacterium]